MSWAATSGSLAEKTWQDEIDEIDQTREVRAKGLVGMKREQIDVAMFQAVCAPVGMSLRALSELRGIQIRQVSHQNRNPQHAVPKDLLSSYQKLQRSHGNGKWVKLDHQWMRSIQVTEGCLVCHGAKSFRPEFIQTKYPADRAWGFQVGDFRGAYVVTQPSIAPPKD